MNVIAHDFSQVPVLVNTAVLATPIAGSLQITFHLADRYPGLIPANRKEEIGRLLRDLHALNYFSLTFAGKPNIAAGNKAAVVKRMEDPAISQRYRDALAYKLTM
jgi:glutathione S-transferase